MSDMAVDHSSEQGGIMQENFELEALPERAVLNYLAELARGQGDTSIVSLRPKERVDGPGGVRYLLVDAIPPGTKRKKPKPLFSYEFMSAGQSEQGASDSTSIAKIFYDNKGVPTDGAIVAVYENDQWRRTGSNI